MIVSLHVKGDERASEHLHGLARRAGNLEPLFTLMSHALFRSERRKFDRGFTKSVVIGHEIRLAPGGITRVTHRRRVRYSLVDTGKLRASLTLLSSPDNVLHPGKDSLEFGTKVFYAKFLRKRGFTLVPIDKRLREDLTGIARDYFLDGAR